MGEAKKNPDIRSHFHTGVEPIQPTPLYVIKTAGLEIPRNDYFLFFFEDQNTTQGEEIRHSN